MYSQHHLTTKFIFKRCQSHNQYLFIKFSIPEQDKNFSFKIHIKVFCNFDINLSDTGILEIISMLLYSRHNFKTKLSSRRQSHNQYKFIKFSIAK